MKQVLLILLHLLLAESGFCQTKDWISFGKDSCSNSGTTCKVLPSGDILYLGSSLCPNSPYPQLSLTRLSKNGAPLWEKQYDLGAAIYIGNAVLKDSLFVVCGQIIQEKPYDADPFIAWMDTNGNLLNMQQYSIATGQQAFKTIQSTADKGWIACGYCTQEDGEANDILVVKFNANGDIEWKNIFGSARNDAAHCITVALDGYVVSGDKQEASSEQYDLNVFKLNDKGEILWEYQSLDPQNDGNQYLMIDQEGNCVLAGESTIAGSQYFDVLLTKLSPLGRLIWRKTAGKPFADTGFGLATTKKGEYLITGYTLSDSTQQSNPYLAKFSKEGEPLGLHTIHIPDLAIGYEIVETGKDDLLIPIYNQNKFYLALLKDSLYEDNFFTSSAVYNQIRNHEDHTLCYFPNPANEQLKIYCEGNYTIRIHDLAGKLVLESSSEQFQDLDISSLKAGYYLVELEGAHQYLIEKLIIQR